MSLSRYFFALCLLFGISEIGFAQSLQPMDLLQTDDKTGFSERYLSISFQEGDTGNSWWRSGYLLDYALIVGGTAGYIIGEDIQSQSNSLIGPSYNPEDRFEFVGDERFSEPYLEQDEGETVPEYWIHRSIALTGALVAGMEWREIRDGRGSAQQLHDTFIGYAESVAVTATVTSMSKPFFARLRPDFAERSQRFHCPDLPSSEYDEYCDGFRDKPLSDDPEAAADLFDDGRKSFISGHSSHAFNLFGYATLAIGGRYVWGDDVSLRSRTVGITTQAALMGTAIFISGSRVTDGRHHTGDVVAGTLVGAAIANIAYWRRFDRSGNLRRSSQEKNRTVANQGFRERADLSVQPLLYSSSEGAGVRALVTF